MSLLLLLPSVRSRLLRLSVLRNPSFIAALMLALMLMLVPAFAQREEARQACGGDVHRLCQGVAPGAGRIVQCLRQRAGELSPACRNFIARAR